VRAESQETQSNHPPPNKKPPPPPQTNKPQKLPSKQKKKKSWLLANGACRELKGASDGVHMFSTWSRTPGGENLSRGAEGASSFGEIVRKEEKVWPQGRRGKTGAMLAPIEQVSKLAKTCTGKSRGDSSGDTPLKDMLRRGEEMNLAQTATDCRPIRDKGTHRGKGCRKVIPARICVEKKSAGRGG